MKTKTTITNKARNLFPNCKNADYLNTLLAKKWTSEDIKDSLLKQLELI